MGDDESGLIDVNRPPSRSFIAMAVIVSMTACERYHASLGLSSEAMRDVRLALRSIIPEAERAASGASSWAEKSFVEAAILRPWLAAAYGLATREGRFLHFLERTIAASYEDCRLADRWLLAFADASRLPFESEGGLREALALVRARFSHLPPVGLKGLFADSPFPPVDVWDTTHQDPWEGDDLATTPHEFWDGQYPDIAMLLLLYEFEHRGLPLALLREEIEPLRDRDPFFRTQDLADWNQIRTRLQLAI